MIWPCIQDQPRTAATQGTGAKAAHGHAAHRRVVRHPRRDRMAKDLCRPILFHGHGHLPRLDRDALCEQPDRFPGPLGPLHPSRAVRRRLFVLRLRERARARLACGLRSPARAALQTPLGDCRLRRLHGGKRLRQLCKPLRARTRFDALLALNRSGKHRHRAHPHALERVLRLHQPLTHRLVLLGGHRGELPHSLGVQGAVPLVALHRHLPHPRRVLALPLEVLRHAAP